MEYPSSRASWLVTLAAIAVAVVFVAMRWYAAIDPDAGLTLTAAWQVSQGLLPYRDFFEFHPPGAFYILAAVFRVVGPSFAAAKFFSLAVMVLTALPFLALARRLKLAPAQRVAALAVWALLALQFPLISYSTYAHLASIWVIWLLISAWQAAHAATPSAARQAVGYFFGLGMAVTAVGWLLQTRGAALALVGLGAAVATRRPRLLVAYAGGLALAALPVLALPLREFWQQTVVYPAQYYPAANTDNALWLAAWLGVTAAGGLAAFAARQRAAAFWLLWLSAVAGMVSIWPHADLLYLSLVLWPLPLLYFAVPLRRVWRWTSGVLLALPVAVLGVLSLSLFITLLPMELRANPFGVGAPYWQELAAAVQARTAPGEPIFATPTLPNLYFFAQRPNATRFNSLFSQQYGPKHFQEAIADLRRVRPKLVVRELDSMAVKIGIHRDGTAVDQYLDQYYEVIAELRGFAPHRFQLLAPKSAEE
ncbi:MAG: hypothetical protein Q7S23_02255 [bacterium]|nr:hypothetical protein [bacterium]